jgi:hypothetical protein
MGAAAALVTIAGGLMVVGPAAAGESDKDTILVSRALGGGTPNGPSRNPAISQDERANRLAAFESDATNIVSGDRNGTSDVFYSVRAGRYGTDGEPYRLGQSALASRGLNGAPANGPSSRPALDGSPRNRPKCVAFISSASNLVRGDTNGVSDAFVFKLGARKVSRVSLMGGNRQSRRPTKEIAVAGDCKTFAFTTGANVYLRRGSRTKLTGRSSSQPVLSNQGNAIAFTSTARLSSRDRNRHPDVYERIVRRGRALRLLSATPSGLSGNGPSSSPAIDGAGKAVAFQTDATNIVAGDTNGVTDIVRRNYRVRGGRADYVSRLGRPGNGASANPTISDAGTFVGFESLATNFDPQTERSDANGVSDVYIWTESRRTPELESRGPDGRQLQAASGNPATSARINYLLFESGGHVLLRYLGPR